MNQRFAASGRYPGLYSAGLPSSSGARRLFMLASTALVAATLTTPTARAAITETGSNTPNTATAGVTNYIGSGAAGSLTVDAGSNFSTPLLGAGAGTAGVGTILVDGAGTQVTLTGAGQLFSGIQGVGSVTVSGGAVINGAAATANSFVGLYGGSTGSLTVTGAGSTLSTTSSWNGAGLYVGSGAVTPTNGIVGGTAVGTVTVSAGGTINASGLAIGQIGFDAAHPLVGAGQTAIGSVSIAGANSAIDIAPVGANGGVLVGGNNVNVPGSSGIGSLSISAGGALNISTNNANFQPGLQIGGAGSVVGGSGTVTVNNGSINFNGPYTGANTPFVNVGRNQSTGTLNVANGGTINGVNSLTVGRDGATGTMTVDGAGSKVTVAPAGTAAALVGVGSVSASPPAGVTTATGILNVRNGGEIDVSLNGSAANVLLVGQRGGNGTLNVTGSGSKIVMSGNNAGAANNPSGIQIGRSGQGALNVTAGAQIVVNDTSGYGFLTIGGAGGQVNNAETAGTGTVLVSGAGSRIDLQSAHSTIAVGRNSTGSLTVQSGGVVDAENIVVGRDKLDPAKPLVNPGSVGNLVVTGVGSQLNLAGNDGAVAAGGNQTVFGGTRLVVGMAGVGTATIANGATVSIDPTTDPANASQNPAVAGGLYIGGGVLQNANLVGNTNIGAGGTGTVNVTGGSTVTIGGSATNSVVAVGGNGTGTLNVGGAGSSVSLPSTGKMYVGAAPPGGGLGTVPLSGVVTVSNGASINAGSFLGIGSDGTNNNTGTGSFILTGGSTVTATNIVVGQHGLFGGNGVVSGNVTNNGGTIQVGASPDTLTIDGAYVQNGGTIDLEVFSNGMGGFLTDTLVFTGPAPVLTGVTFDFTFFNVDPDTFLHGANPLDTLSTFLTTTSTTPLDFQAIAATSNAAIASAPEPGTLSLLFAGLMGLAARRHSWLSWTHPVGHRARAA